MKVFEKRIYFILASIIANIIYWLTNAEAMIWAAIILLEGSHAIEAEERKTHHLSWILILFFGWIAKNKGACELAIVAIVSYEVFRILIGYWERTGER